MQTRCVVSVPAGKLARTTCGSINHVRFTLAPVGAVACCMPARSIFICHASRNAICFSPTQEA